jgi:hypothetical protein
MKNRILISIALVPLTIALAKGEVSVGAAKGVCVVFDGYDYRYTAFSAKISYGLVPHVALGFKVDWEVDPTQYEPELPADWYKNWVLTPSLMVNSRFVALEAGPALFINAFLHSPSQGVLPSAYLRLGPEDLIFLTGSIFSESPPVYVGMAIRIGVGTGERLLPTKTKLWFGVGGGLAVTGVFIGRVEQKITQKFTVVLSGDLGMGYGLALGVKYGF